MSIRNVMSASYIAPENIQHVVKSRANVTKLFKVMHLNARSLEPKKDVTLLLESCGINFDLLMFTETWYTSESEHFMLPGFNHFFLNRTESRVGGVAILTTLEFCEVIEEYSLITKNYEALCIKKGTNVFAVLYRPPSGSLADFLTFIDLLLSHANAMNYMLTVGGDFNVDVLKNTVTSNEFLSVLECNSFKYVITMPTRVTESTMSLLDMFVTNSITEETISRVLSCDLSDHLPIFIFLKMHTNPAYVKPEEFTYRSVTPATLEHFRHRIKKIGLE